MSVAQELERIDETDIVWVEGKPKSEESDVIVFLQNESGFAGFGACMALMGETPKLVAKIFSKLMTVPAFNNIPHPLFPEWRLYETRNDEGHRYFFLRINHTHPTSVNGEEYDNAFTWLYTYPIYASIIRALTQIGVVRSHVVCADLLPNEDHVMKLRLFDFTNEDSTYCDDWEEDITLLPHSWIWASVFNSFCAQETEDKLSNVVVTPHPEEFIDRVGINLILEYGKDVLGIEPSNDSLKNALKSLEQLEAATNEFVTLANWYGDDIYGEA
tara:strand:+ start:7200 stop:8015 length:816 start_codon:yes stop_codon:yes gene_type:complete